MGEVVTKIEYRDKEVKVPYPVHHYHETIKWKEPPPQECPEPKKPKPTPPKPYTFFEVKKECNRDDFEHYNPKDPSHRFKDFGCTAADYADIGTKYDPVMLQRLQRLYMQIQK